MQFTLTDVEQRVLGSLIEKAFTTPEYYPMTVNALVNACNQKSNRNPVVSFDERTVEHALSGLREKGLVRRLSGGEYRVPKYCHYFGEALDITHEETVILCELMLRGPQTPAELRSRAERFNITLSQDKVENALAGLAGKPDNPLVVMLPRQTGQKEARYAHLLGEFLPELTEAVEPRPAAPARTDRIGQLEAEVQQLRRELQELREEFTAFTAQFS